jgi:hypothetical protein
LLLLFVIVGEINDLFFIFIESELNQRREKNLKKTTIKKIKKYG